MRQRHLRRVEQTPANETNATNLALDPPPPHNKPWVEVVNATSLPNATSPNYTNAPALAPTKTLAPTNEPIPQNYTAIIGGGICAVVCVCGMCGAYYMLKRYHKSGRPDIQNERRRSSFDDPQRNTARYASTGMTSVAGGDDDVVVVIAGAPRASSDSMSR
jgi:hypothetical protein